MFEIFNIDIVMYKLEFNVTLMGNNHKIVEKSCVEQSFLKTQLFN